MKRRTTAVGAGRGKGKLETKAKSADFLQFRPQEWQRFSDQGAGLRANDLKALDKVFQEIYKPGERGGLKDALDQMLSLQNEVLQLGRLCEVRFTVCLVNETEGLDRDKRDALIRAVAKDVAGAGRANHPDPEDMLPIDIDSESPNADVRVLAVEDNPSPADASVPEIMVTMSVLAHNADFARKIVERIAKLQVQADEALQWPTAMERMIEELQRGDTRDERLEAMSIRFLTNPHVRELATDFITHSRLPEPASGYAGHACVPRRHETMSTLILGGRDPHKNDLLKWIVGVDPQSSMRSPSLSSQHCFTSVFASSYADDYRGYHIACRMGSVEDEVSQAIRMSHAELLKQSEAIAGRGAPLDRRQFEEVMSTVLLSRVDANDRPIPLGTLQIEELWSKAQLWGLPDEQGVVHRSGQVYLSELLAAFRPSKDDKDGRGDGSAAARRKLMNAGKVDRDNDQRLQKIQEALRAVEAERKREADHGRLRAIQVKEDGRAEAMRKKFQEVAAVTEAKAMAAEKAVLTNKAILDDPHADAKAIAKAQKGLAQATTTIAEAKKQLEQAQKQHEAAVMAAVRVKDMQTHFPDATTTLQSVEAVEEKLRALMKGPGGGGGGRLPDVFLDMDHNSDGRLSVTELRDGLEQILRKNSVSLSKGLLDQVVARMDVSGDGFVDIDEFMYQFDVSDASNIRRMKPSLDGLPCLAAYHGQAKVPYFKDGKAKVWSPMPTEDFGALGRLFNALVGKKLDNNKYRVSFVHKVVDPLAPAEDRERIIYDEFSDFPDQFYVITQECGLEELRLSHVCDSAEALSKFVEHRLRVMQDELIERLMLEVQKRTSVQDQRGMELRVVEALALGDRARVLFEDQRGLHHLWEQWKDAVPTVSRSVTERDNTKYEIELAVRMIEEEEQRCARLMAQWGVIAATSAKPLDTFISREACLFFRHFAKPKPPMLLQAPELLAVSKPKDDGQSDILMKVQRFFGDPTSREPVERQIKRKFDEFDKDATGGLNKTEFKALLKATVNRGEERLGAAEVDSLIELLDADGSDTIEVDELLNAIKPRGEKCPYDQIQTMDFFASCVRRLLILVDIQHTRFNLWEKEIIRHLHRKYRGKIFFASYVSVENQSAIKKAEAIMKLVYSTALDLAKYLDDEQVGRDLRSNVLHVGALIDFSVDRDGHFKVRGSKGQSEWRRLPNALGRLLVHVLTSEAHDAKRMLRETQDTVQALSYFLLKSLKFVLPQLQAAREDSGVREIKGPLAHASNAMLAAAALVEKHAEAVEKKLQVLEVQAELTDLRKACKHAKKTANSVLQRLGMDALSQAEERQLAQAAQDKALAIQLAVRQGKILEWTTKKHVEAWLQVVEHRSLNTGALLRKVADQYNISAVDDIVMLDASKIRRCLADLRSGDEEEDVEETMAVVHEVNRVRSSFWGVQGNMGAAQRSVWLLVREQFLQLEDLKLIYALFHKQMAIPQYWERAVVDGLELLTTGLLPGRPLTLIRVPGTLKVKRWDGSIKTKEISHWYFTDGEKDEQQKPVLGQVSADSVTALILHVRKDILELVGWSPNVDPDKIEEEQYGWRVPPDLQNS